MIGNPLFLHYEIYGRPTFMTREAIAEVTALLTEKDGVRSLWNGHNPI